MSEQPPRAEAPLAAFVEGILDGRVGDGAKLLAATAALSRAGAGEFQCDIQGGRFSLLPVETRIAAAGFDAGAQERFLASLHELLVAAAPGSVETNLRCRLVYSEEVAETLFVVRGDHVEPLTRRRPRTPADAADAAPARAPSPFALRRREVLWLAPILLLLGAFVAWQSGWIDRALAARAGSMQFDTGPFGAMLSMRVEPSWGDYEVALRRGPDYPATPQAAAELLARQVGPAQRTACSVVADGRDLFVQVLDAQQHVLAERRADLRPLLLAPDAVVLVTVPGRMRAAALRLSVTAAARPK